jgi:hypothetical protein
MFFSDTSVLHQGWTAPEQDTNCLCYPNCSIDMGTAPFVTNCLIIIPINMLLRQVRIAFDLIYITPDIFSV